MIVQNAQWNLREFRLSETCPTPASCTLSVQHVTVKDNPAGVLFKGTHLLAPMFQSTFPDQVCPLSRNDPARITMSMSSNDFNDTAIVDDGMTMSDTALDAPN